MACLTLITDYGTADHYVGVVKGVLHSIAADLPVIDITHDIRAHDVVQAAFILRQVWNWYPAGTVHLTIVDPGVGSRRRILAGKYGGRYVVAPDNGLISMVHHEIPIEDLRVVDNPRLCLPTISPTFQGRDIMAPVAARLAKGLHLREVGPTTDHLEVLPNTRSVSNPHVPAVGTVLHVDRFGNLITSLHKADLVRIYHQRSDAQVYIDGRCVGPLRTCYAEADVGAPLALLGSSDYLEISVNCGRADEVLGCGAAAKVEVK